MAQQERKAIIKNADMTDEMQNEAIDMANQVTSRLYRHWRGIT